MQALILAAGRGSRLGSKSSDVPKCLLEVGRRPIIEHQLKTLADAGVGPVAMVLGYCADEIKDVVGIRAEYILNPRWSSTNSLYSFWLAREWVSGSLIILNCDTLFHPGILDRLLAIKGDAIAYDSSSGDGREHMKVNVVNGLLRSMSKELPPQEVSGENLGILSFTAETMEALFRKAEGVISDGGEKRWLGSAVAELIRERETRAVDVAGLPWGEIDFPYDLDRVRKEVWPAIRRASRTRSRRWRLVRWAASALAVAIVFLLTGFGGWFSPVEMTWETVDLENAEKVRIRAGDRRQTWMLIGADETAEFQVVGAGRVRIDSRLVLTNGGSAEAPYVLEIGLDNERLGWFKKTGKPSNEWRHPQLMVAKRERITRNLPAGTHTLTVALIASDAGSCLVRVRQEVVEDGD